jgi:hypothetical protein
MGLALDARTGKENRVKPIEIVLSFVISVFTGFVSKDPVAAITVYFLANIFLVLLDIRGKVKRNNKNRNPRIA